MSGHIGYLTQAEPVHRVVSVWSFAGEHALIAPDMSRMINSLKETAPGTSS